MDLNNLDITVGQLLQNREAKQILEREFPNLVNSPMSRLYSSMPLRQVIVHAKSVVPDEKIQRIIKKLEMI